MLKKISSRFWFVYPSFVPHAAKTNLSLVDFRSKTNLGSFETPEGFSQVLR